MRMMTDNVIRKFSIRVDFCPNHKSLTTKECFLKTILFSYDGEVYDSVELSKWSHLWTLGLANYKGKALTTGCNSFGECSFKTELLDMTTQKWSDGPDYPFVDREK